MVVLTFPIGDERFDLWPASKTTFWVLGVAIIGNTEVMFQLEFTHSTVPAEEE